MLRIIQYFKKFSPGILSGILIGTSTIPFPPWALFFGYALVWAKIINKSTDWREAFWQGWWTQFVISLIGFHWVAYVAHEFGYLPWPIAFGALLLFAALMHLYIPVAVLLTNVARRRFGFSVSESLILLVCLHSLGEMLWPSIFAWNLGYHLLWANLPLAQWADTVGFLGLSFVVHATSAVILWIWLHRTQRVRAAWVTAVLFLLLLTGHFTGEQKRQYWDQKLEQSQQFIRPLFVQANIGNLEKVRAEKGGQAAQSILDQFHQLTEQALHQDPSADLIVWPETAVPFSLDPELQRWRVTAFYEGIQRWSRPLITGAFSEQRQDQDWLAYNALFFINADGTNAALSPYRKTHLLVFGEYVPFADWFPWLKKLNPGGEGFARGPGPRSITENFPWKVGGQICYESLDPHFSRQLTQQGARILVNVTNDSWFGPTSEPPQHLMATFARAIENRRPLLRSTNTGITATIDASGKISEQSPLAQSWAKVLPTRILPDNANAQLTLYTRFGHWLTWLPIMIISGLLVRNYFRRSE